MKEPFKSILVTVGAGLLLASILGAADFVIDTKSRLAVIESTVKSMDESLKTLVKQGRD